MIQRRAHTVDAIHEKKNIELKIRFAGEVTCQDDILLMIGEAWYHDIKKFGGDPMACMEKIHAVMKDWPIDRSASQAGDKGKEGEK